jgi:hypothetical protein
MDGLEGIRSTAATVDQDDGAHEAAELIRLEHKIGLKGRLLLAVACATADGVSNFAKFPVEEEPGRAKNWAFIIPDVAINGSRGVVIKLFHGAVVSWDGRKIRHCSSIPKPGDDNNVYGCMFGSCN